MVAPYRLEPEQRSLFSCRFLFVGAAHLGTTVHHWDQSPIGTFPDIGGWQYPSETDRSDLLTERSLPSAVPNDTCNAQVTKRSQLRSVPWNTVQLGLKLYEAISQELAAAHNLLLTTGQRSAAERVATFLLATVRRCRRNARTQP